MVTEIVKVKQIVIERPMKYQVKITSTRVAVQIEIAEIGNEGQEVLLLVFLDSKNRINAINRVFQGSLNFSVAHPKEIFRSALLNNGARILLFHNHRRMLRIELLDHIIVSDLRVVFMQGMLPFLRAMSSCYTSS